MDKCKENHWFDADYLRHIVQQKDNANIDRIHRRRENIRREWNYPDKCTNKHRRESRDVWDDRGKSDGIELVMNL